MTHFMKCCSFGYVVVMYRCHPPRLEAEFTEKLMLVDCQFKIIHLLLNILIKIELLGDRQNSKKLSGNYHPKRVSFT